LAPHISLPPYAQSSVLACWLGFGQAGLASLLAPALLGALQNIDCLFWRRSLDIGVSCLFC